MTQAIVGREHGVETESKPSPDLSHPAHVAEPTDPLAVLHRIRGMLHNLCRVNYLDLDDLAQDIWLEWWEARSRPRPLFISGTLVLHRIHDAMRRAGRHRPVDLDKVPQPVAPAEPEFDPELVQKVTMLDNLVRRAGLTSLERQLLFLRFHRSMLHTDIALELRLRPDNVSQGIASALTKLRQVGGQHV